MSRTQKKPRYKVIVPTPKNLLILAHDTIQDSIKNSQDIEVDSTTTVTRARMAVRGTKEIVVRKLRE